MRILFYYLLTLLVPMVLYANTPDATIQFKFYGTPIEITYSPEILNTSLGSELSENTFEDFDKEISSKDVGTILQQLFAQKTNLDLNDWLYYLLIRASIDAIFNTKTENFKTLAYWVMLNKSGYDVKLNYFQNQLSLSVFTTDEVFEMPRRAERNGWYVDISSFFKDGYTTMPNSFSSTIPSSNNILFHFYLEKLPIFTNPVIEERTYKFIHDNQENELNVKVNKNAVRIMYRYPETTIKQQSTIPMSLEARTSLIPKLKEKVRTMGNYEAVRYLLGFTRQAFRYKTDSEAYGLENVTFSPEETLFYPDSDCEDRSILFVFLVREVLMLDAILIDYPEHASAAVNFKTTSYGEPILYNGSKYTICEPTGPGNDLLPGQYPNGLENVPFNIIDK
ncbi:MAG: hypothetical protein KA783_11580 [Chitinophagales bacterium]|jgi:hypothetical protein|nr:hypothetical protein [Sphingobacteriales bacterium]MBP6664292.1 hypothetical protein [Chitinophagales bacterium]MBP7535079.1 hypothetical protein [Chitinophagales bacterium]